MIVASSALEPSLGQTTVDIVCQQCGNHGNVTIPLYRDRAVLVTCHKCNTQILVMPEKTPNKGAQHEQARQYLNNQP